MPDAAHAETAQRARTIMLWIGSVVPWPDGRLGQLLTATQSNCGLAISGVSVTTSLGSVQPLQKAANTMVDSARAKACASPATHLTLRRHQC